jgi:lipopolysaccharide transport system ATP-binding protein
LSELAIRAENLRKQYRVGASASYRMLRDSIADAARVAVGRRRRDTSDETIWALDGVSFEVEPGRIVGIIGANGAGKSTLLKILSRITEPTEGQAELHGRVGALLEVGTGFHPELTGRENVFLNGAILGMSRSEIEQKLPEIVGFAGVDERFMETPLKRFSSGMAVRLGFAVAAYLEPEILIVDEVLAVGDLAFQERCIGKMKEVASGGRTVLFVSHNMSSILALCDDGIWLDGGKIAYRGTAAEAVARYVDASRLSGGSALAEGADRRGSGALLVTHVRLEDEDGLPLQAPTTGQTVRFVLEYETRPDADLSELIVNVTLSQQGGRGLVSFMSQVSGAELHHIPGTGRVVCTVAELPLMPGHYNVLYSCVLGRELADKVWQAGSLVVAEGDYFGTGRLPPNSDYYGPLLARHAWSVEPARPRVEVGAAE